MSCCALTAGGRPAAKKTDVCGSFVRHIAWQWLCAATVLRNWTAAHKGAILIYHIEHNLCASPPNILPQHSNFIPLLWLFYPEFVPICLENILLFFIFILINI